MSEAAEAQRRLELLAMLEERRRDVETRFRAARERQQSAEAAGDSEGVHGWKAAREGGPDLAILASLDRTLKQIDRAIRRVHAGTYGLCAACGGAIPLGRLHALPFATACVPCQTRSESSDPGR
ncbi:MAG: TraR/DksA family transcriptional regulator [Candidatus Polarisedimenticolia bacterium]